MGNIISMLLFIIPFLAGVFGSHYLIYYTVVRSFPITSVGAKLLIFLVPMFLTLSFIFSALLLRVHRNLLTEGYMVISLVWLGLFINLIMAAILIWVFFFATAVFGAGFNMRLACYIGLALAVAVTAYGMINALNPRIKNIDVELRNLPGQWKGKTIVHLSDVHLGVINNEGYLRRIVSMVNELEPELILITGDLFDGMGGGFEPLIGPLNEFRAERGVFFVTGNHEGYLQLAEPLAILEQTQVRVLDNEVVDIDGLQIVGIAFPEHDRKDDAQRVLDLAGKIDPEKPNILMYHTPTDIDVSPPNRGAQQNRTYFAPNTRFSFAAAHGIDLQLSGHTHQGQFFPFTLVARLIFKGYEYGLHQDGDFQIYITSGTGTWGPPMRIAGKSEIVVIRLQ